MPFPDPVDPVNMSRPGEPFLNLVLPLGTVLIYLVGYVHGDMSGAGGSSCCGCGGHSQPPASLSWKRLLRALMRAPNSSSWPEEASASKTSPGGIPVPVGCHVLSGLSSPVGCPALCV